MAAANEGADNALLQGGPRNTPARVLKPFDRGEIKVLLLEGVAETGVELLTKAGYQVEYHVKALPVEQLIEKIAHVHVVGIRSKTQLTAEVLQHAKKLQAIGCFCIGTNQVDLDYAAQKGICVFNSPFSNSRSVAELVMAEVVCLARQIADRVREMHDGNWQKKSAGCREIRSKTLGIVGYGHIGTQLSVMADAMGMKVIFFDVLQIMPLGTAQPMDTLDEVLEQADFVTLHVPDTPETRNMITREELMRMKKGAYLINASRGTVVDIEALAEALRSGHLAGAAVDVYPSEPLANGAGWENPLRGCPNTILTPHIGGSTEEAQYAIGVEVGAALTKFVNTGCTLNAVNFPETDLRPSTTTVETARIINCHRNVPGVLKQINKILSDYNIEKQISDSNGAVAYFMADVVIPNDKTLAQLYMSLSKIDEAINTRILY
ncbi:hypothetical protein CXG81DRAFT_29761 [Caulochytrium protostelioides]|uniref:S-adenosyl-L-homocysteine hydrolase NAD binding domain-containing protein n=1 Tax=Caulochytrium protostelioides TaxID=1555241 RepID=A0A4P9X812_9FUNG|nr:hypothetical protein CXG81DRAFT_29761 [Caulochytrium protostelioides]|eukprot:RKP01385.1 hypothetical protein CXG81DRAFT_29761 [Caulochytrium protostelioides]